MLGRLLRSARAGKWKVAYFRREVASGAESLQVSSESFAHSGEIPIRYTAFGKNLSPPLRWMDVPEGARSILVVIEDPDAPLPIPFVHAIVYNLQPNGELAEGAISARNAHTTAGRTDDFRTGRCTFGKAAYRGPGPIADHGPHRYFFQVFALDCGLDFEAPPKRRQILRAIDGHVLAKGLLVGKFERRSATAN